MSLAPLDLVSAYPWQRAAFTTYALSLSFFEAVVLDALVRAEAHAALILADVDGVRAALGEYGARRRGLARHSIASMHALFRTEVQSNLSALSKWVVGTQAPFRLVEAQEGSDPSLGTLGEGIFQAL